MGIGPKQKSISNNQRGVETEAILSTGKRARNFPYCQGPPGTGKTHTTIQLLRLLAKAYASENIPILVTAFTNVATDNLLEGLLDNGVRALRIGRPVKVEASTCPLNLLGAK